MHKESQQEINWQREVIEKIINDKYGPSNQKKQSIWFWLCLLLIIFVVYHVYRSFFQRTAPSEHIALLHLDGEISTRNDTLKNFTDSLEEIYDNQRYVKAVILEADSPGGSPVIADTIYQQIKHYQARYPRIPIYTVINDVCASGCYYIASATNKIYANRVSLVGSIGVIMMDIDASELAHKLGIKDRTKTAGEYKTLANPLQKQSPEQQQYLSHLLAEVHTVFIDSVKNGRGKRLHWQEHPEIFSGKIYTGIDAQKLGLIDGFAYTQLLTHSIMGKHPRVLDYTADKDWHFYAKKLMGTQFNELFTAWLTAKIMPHLH